jgi:hypothetical protein
MVARDRHGRESYLDRKYVAKYLVRGVFDRIFSANTFEVDRSSR